MYRVSLVKDVAEIEKNQNVIIEYLLKVLDKSPEFTLKSVLQNIQKGHSQLWLVYRDAEVLGAIVTQKVTYPVKERLLIHLCGGKDIKEWLDLYMETVEEWAKEKGLGGVEIVGRKGWVKLLPDYTTSRVMIIKEF